MASWQEKVHPELRRRVLILITNLNGFGIDARVVQSFRTFAEQDALYAQGRGKTGKKVTNARGGQSNHNYGLAVDLCPFVSSKPDWTDIASFKKIGQEAKKLGLEWGGDWATFKDMPHVQLKGMSIKECQWQNQRGGLEAVWGKMDALLKGASNGVSFNPKQDDLIEFGDRGDEVTKLQTRLVELRFMQKHEIDGDFGKVTKNAVIAFQRLNKLTADGIVGDGTKARLYPPKEPVFDDGSTIDTFLPENTATGALNAQPNNINIDSEQLPALGVPLESPALNNTEDNQSKPLNEAVPNQPPDNKEKIFVPKPVSKTFWERMKAKILGVTSGNVTVQALTDNAQQAGALGLSPRFWTIAIITIVVGSIIYLIYEWHKSRQDDKKQLALTELLVKENSTPDNIVELIEPDLVELYKTKGKVISR